jgi:hypothetical protein
MPNYVNVDPKPFHPDTYVGPEHEDEESQQQHVEAREKSMSIKLKVENTVRWKWTKDASGKDVRRHHIHAHPKHFAHDICSKGNPTAASSAGQTAP